eukprot:scaffold3622_cov145-Skeletonema_dohrnii-CCMP3373.AAC.10
MMILNQSNVDGEDCTSEHHTSVPSPSQSQHDREELDKSCLKPAKQPPKDDEASTGVVKEDEGTDDVQHHDAAAAKPQRKCRSKHSQRRAAKWRSQQRGRIRQPDDGNG